LRNTKPVIEVVEVNLGDEDGGVRSNLELGEEVGCGEVDMRWLEKVRVGRTGINDETKGSGVLGDPEQTVDD